MRDQQKSRLHVLIAGAGIGGLAAAVALRQQGCSVQLFERAAGPQELGFDLMLAPNAMAALMELGVADALGGAATTINAVSATIGRHGSPRHVDLADVPAALRPVIVSRQAVHGSLLAATGIDAISFGTDVIGFRSHAGGVAIKLHDGRDVEGDVLVGADGVRWVIRRCLHPNIRPRPHRLTGIRGVAYGVQHLLGTDFAMKLVPGADAGVIRGAHDSVYWFVTARAETDAEMQRCVAAFGQPLQAVMDATRPGDMRCERLLEIDAFVRWGDGRLTLLGDAAHPMLPHAGQGAAQALEDAVALGLALGSRLTPCEALRRYETVRSRRTAKVVSLSRRLSLVRTSRSAVTAALLKAAVHMVPSDLLRLTRWARPRDPHTELREI